MDYSPLAYLETMAKIYALAINAKDKELMDICRGAIGQIANESFYPKTFISIDDAAKASIKRQGD